LRYYKDPITLNRNTICNVEVGLNPFKLFFLHQETAGQLESTTKVRVPYDVLNYTVLFNPNLASIICIHLCNFVFFLKNILRTACSKSRLYPMWLMVKALWNSQLSLVLLFNTQKKEPA
jgi:hypothetical protein